MTLLYLAIFLVSVATLTFEIVLTRVFSLAQGYHFAFMVVGIALLGFGVSGTILSLFGSLVRGLTPKRLSYLAFLFSLGCLGGYVLVNYIPFDSYQIAWDRRQVVYLVIYYLSLLVPFLFSGLITGATISAYPNKVSRIYFYSLGGSSVGSLSVILLIPWLGGEGVIVISALLGLAASFILTLARARGLASDRSQKDFRDSFQSPGKMGSYESSEKAGKFLPKGFRSALQPSFRVLVIGLALLLLFFLFRPPDFLQIKTSPYKSLSVISRYPDSRIVYSRWNSFSKVDVIDSDAIKSAPGLSLAYHEPPPKQMGVTVDGDDLSPITRFEDERSAEFTRHMATAVAYRLKERPRVLIIEPRGGLNLLQALSYRSDLIWAVESNPTIIELMEGEYAEFSGHIYDRENVRIVNEIGRSYIRRSGMSFDLIILSLADTFKATLAGTYSLTENYTYTTEAILDYYDHLSPGGWLVVQRWLQIPPSESVRLFSIILEALERMGVESPDRQLVALRSWSTVVVLVKKGEVNSEDVAKIKDFCEEEKFDLVYYPGIRAEEVNRFNVLEKPEDYLAFKELAQVSKREAFYQGYFYDVTPVTDDRPFFFHFFKVSQIPFVLRSWGKTMQPFGGGGFLVLLVLLAIALFLSASFILLPLVYLRLKRGGSRGDVPPAGFKKSNEDPFLEELKEGTPKEHSARGARGRKSEKSHPRSIALITFTYFFSIGLGFLFVGIPLMQKYILFLGHPVYSISVVLFSLLLFSGLGSLISERFRKSVFLPPLLVGLLILLYVFLIGPFFNLFLKSALSVRLLMTFFSLAPLGFLMGMPFPAGIRMLRERDPKLIAWAWGVNGFASVVASIGAAILAISFGFSVVLLTGSGAYLISSLVIRRACLDSSYSRL